MVRTVMGFSAAVLLAGTLFAQAPSQSQAAAPAATYVSKGDLNEVLQKATAGDRPNSDTTAKTVSGKPNVMVNIGHRTKAGASMNGGSHSNLIEVWYITEGSGTVTTGGTFQNPNQSASGDVRGTIQNGVDQRVTVGDVIVIPPGTPHTFSAIDTPLLVFLNIRIEASK